MASSVKHTIKIKFHSGIKCISQYQKMNPHNLQKRENRLNKVYGSDWEQAPKILNGTLFSYASEKIEIFLPLKKNLICWQRSHKSM